MIAWIPETRLCFRFDVVFLFRLTVRCCLAGTKPSVLLLLLVYVINLLSGGGRERFAICESRFSGARQCFRLVLAFCLSLQHCCETHPDSANCCLTSILNLRTLPLCLLCFCGTVVLENRVWSHCRSSTLYKEI